MTTKISGLAGRERLRTDIAKRIETLLERRSISARAVRVAFFDDDGPRGGVAIRCALTLTPSRGPLFRAEHTARTHAAAFDGALTVLTRQLKRRVQRRRRHVRHPRPGPAVRRRLTERWAESDTEASQGRAALAGRGREDARRRVA